MDIGSILLGLALLLVIAFIVARPLLEPPAVRDLPASPADRLLARREQVLAQLRDLDFDSATGKFNAEDYAAQRAQLVAEGVDILKQLDALGVSSEQAAAPATLAGAPASAPSGAPADEIEAAVAQLRARRAAAGRPAAAPSKTAIGEEIEASVAARRAARVVRPAA